MRWNQLLLAGLMMAGAGFTIQAQEAPKAYLDGTGPGFKALTGDDFTRANCNEDTWKFHADGLITCTGNPVGVIRSKKQYTNLELVVEWRT